MLIKKELEKIAVQRCPDFPFAKGKREAIYCAAIKIAKLPRGGRILVIDVFEKVSSHLRMRFFSDGINFIICKEWPSISWVKQLPSEFLLSSYLLSPVYIDAADKDIKKTHEFLKKGQTGWRYLNGILSEMDDFVRGIYQRKQIKYMQNKYSLMDSHFKMFPDYPDDLEEYCDAKVFRDTYIFISKIQKDKREALCGNCGSRFEVDRSVRPGKWGHCPKCNMPGKYRGDWVGGETKKAMGKICIAHKVDDQLIMRWIKIKRCFAGTEKRYEFEDYYLNLYLKTPKGNIIYAYQYKSVMGYGGKDWCRQKNGLVNHEKTFVYTNNLREVFGDKYYNVDLQAGLQNAGELSFARLLDNLSLLAPAEYLFKLGLISLASDHIEWNLAAGFGIGALGINRQYLPMYQKFDINRHEHEIIKASKTHVSEDSFRKFRLLGYLPGQDLNDVKKLLQTISFERFVNYFLKQILITHTPLLHDVLILYRDYLSMSETLKVDMSRKAIRFPKNIKYAHDQLLPRFNQIKYKADDDELKQAIKNGLYAGMREFQNDVFCVVFPTLRSEIVTEGQSLSHCVGHDRYYKNHIAGTNMIFFVRKTAEKSKPFITMEIDNQAKSISQLRGFKDLSAPPEVKKFANEFLKRLFRREKPHKIASG